MAVLVNMKVIDEETLNKLRIKKQAQNAINKFFAVLPKLTKNTKFVEVNMGCKVYVPVSHIKPGNEPSVVFELERMYKMIVDNSV